MLHLDRVSKSFAGIMALRDVSLSVEEGDFLGVIGPNGAGKTTLFNLVGGAFTPSQGRIYLDGRDITSRSPAERCKMGILRTFQRVKPFLHLSVLENVLVGCYFRREPLHSRRQAQAAAFDLLEWVGLEGRAAEPAFHLTLGERKRLELARALAADPRLLMLDEYLAGLNPTEVQGALELIGRVHKRGVTILMVEHLVQAIFSIASRIVVLSAGEKIAEGKPAEVARDPVVIDAYLGKSHDEQPA